MTPDMDRRAFLSHAGAATTALALAHTAGAAEATPRRPNIIYAFSDEHRWHSIHHTEMPALQTPNMDRLAQQGASFTRCISNYPVCSPYRAMLMTGRWPWQTGVNDNGIALDPSNTTLGKTFKAAGYDTAYIGKWHLGGTRAEPFGFDHSLIWTEDNEHWDTSRYHPADAAPVRPKGYNATRMTDQALDYLRARKPDAAPFCMLLSWNPPHSRFTDPPEPKKALYPDGALPYRGNAPKDAAHADSDAFRYGWPEFQGYHAHISAIDDELGRLMRALDELGLANDTILIYTSDHGSMMGSQGLGGKRQPFEESIHVPFIARLPGHIAPGLKLDPLVGTIDLFPTLCGLCGIGAPALPGVDCSPWLLGAAGPARDTQPIMHLSKKNAANGEEHPAPLFYGLRTRTHTYALRDSKPWLLFDLAADPLQQTNLIDSEAHASLQHDLHQQMLALYAAQGHPLA